ncbi:MAG TPA: Pr6Pr family membrane protein [Candidatus Limnocylindrales bacterium]
MQVAVPWVDFVLHKLFPVVVVLDWLIDPSLTRLTFRQSLVWLVYPLVWVVFTLIRGAIENWYPYPFLDPANGGYGSVAVVSAGIFVGFLVIIAITVTLGNTMRDRGRRPVTISSRGGGSGSGK